MALPILCCSYILWNLALFFPCALNSQCQALLADALLPSVLYVPVCHNCCGAPLQASKEQEPWH